MIQVVMASEYCILERQLLITVWVVIVITVCIYTCIAHSDSDLLVAEYFYSLLPTPFTCRDEFSPPAVRRRQDSTMSTGSERNSLPDKTLMDDINDALGEGQSPFIT